MADQNLTKPHLRTPKAAGAAGMLFSLLAIVSFWLLWVAVPADPQEAGAWLHGSAGMVALAVNLMPFSGIALLWFIAVLRDRMSEREDRFFATVFLGSGLLFIAMYFLASCRRRRHSRRLRCGTCGADQFGDLSLRARFGLRYS